MCFPFFTAFSLHVVLLLVCAESTGFKQAIGDDDEKELRIVMCVRVVFGSLPSPVSALFSLTRGFVAAVRLLTQERVFARRRSARQQRHRDAR